MPVPEPKRNGVTLLLLSALLAACVAKENAESGQRAMLGGDIGNAAISGLDGLPGAITLSNGSWEGRPYVAGGNARPRASLLPEFTARGDLDGDGTDDSVGVLVVELGGSGSFVYLVTAPGGSEAASPALLLGDRVRVRSLTIVGTTIELDTQRFADDDPMCCPSLDARQVLVLEDGELLGVETEISESDVRRQFGFVVWGHEARSFTPCGASEAAWLVDRTTDAVIAARYTDFAVEPYETVFMDLVGRDAPAPAEGFGSDYASAFEATSVLRVEREGWGCGLDIEGLVYRASGNEPGWLLEIRPGGGTLTRQGSGAPVELTLVAYVAGGSFTFSSAEGDLEAQIERRDCRDSMSGAFASHSIGFTFGDARYRGCAVPGSVAELSAD